MPLRRVFRPFRSAAERNGGRLRINLGLQGGGTHGAFTWGVLDRLLEDERVVIDAVSGASAGALNAVALTDGLASAGRAGARAKLDAVWNAVAAVGGPPALGVIADGRSAMLAFDLVTRLFAPTQINPYMINPLRDILLSHIDFRRVRRAAPIEMFIAATDVSSGLPRIFRRRDASAKVVLASACLPRLMPPVRIAGRLYWDGGFSANPPLWPLLEAEGPNETLVIALEPLRAPAAPATAAEIDERLAWLVFAQPLAQELAAIDRARLAAANGTAVGGQLRRRLRRHRFVFIEGGPFLAPLGRASRVFPDEQLLLRLKAAGRQAADAWLAGRFAAAARSGRC
jgi:NTE family protein